MNGDERLQHALAVLTRHGAGEPRSVRTTDAEHDLLVLVETPTGGAVLKQTPPGSSSAAMQAGLLQHVAQRDPGLPVPRLMRTAEGGALTESAHGTAFVSTMLPGTPLEQLEIDASIVDALVGLQRRMLLALEDADAELLRVPARNAWSIESLLDAEPLIAVHASGPLAGLARSVMDEHRVTVAPALAVLPRQVLHADFNLSNLLAADGGISGIIDFGDAIHAPRILDVAVTAAYLALGLGDIAHPLVHRYLRGAREAIALSEAELVLVPGLIRARVVLVLLLGRENARRDPERAAYALRFDRQAERLAAAMIHAGQTGTNQGTT